MREREFHGMARTPEYRAWQDMKTRVKIDERYIKRGIKVCKLFEDSFLAFFDEIGPRPAKGFSVDRKDNNKGYEVGNIRWATRKEQQNNLSSNRMLTCDGITMTMQQWSDKMGFSKYTIRSRLIDGWSIEAAIKTPLDVSKVRNHKLAIKET